MGRSKITFLAENTALGIRGYLRLQPLDRMDPYELARRLPIRVVTPQDIGAIPPDVLQQALGLGKDDWSAGTLDLPGERHLIVLNPTHSRLRMKSTLMEEICHIVLGHNPSRLGGYGTSWFRSYDTAVFGIYWSGATPQAASLETTT